ncbi:MAG: DUF4954 family protein [Planctomycetes bacterium]|nr:DUF4954 family protein [Planctomycetota bacterium]
MGSLGRGFIPPEFLPDGTDAYYLRNEQARRAGRSWRSLRAEEIETLVKNGNTSENWDDIRVGEHFAPHLVKNCEFYGLVRIGRLDEVYLEHHELTVPVGLTNSRIISCDIGDNAAIHNVRYLAHYVIGDHVILLNLDEMHTTNHAKFGNGIVKDGEPQDVRISLDVINEAGGRRIYPFDGMICADAALWAMNLDDRRLCERLLEITQRQFDPRRGFYGQVGDNCVIKNTRTIKDVKVGPCCYIKGANKLKNLTINSSADQPSQIGEGVELVNGVIGFGCHVFYGCKAVRFVMCDNTNLKYGARLIHSVLGDNSTISCCEVLNDLIFPAHEQHHNNSFLIASLVMGQSNIAACATIGSNHNSRAPDGEIHAGRGFWPGLCVSLKHNCRFASFVLLAKGDYPHELNVPLPFALVSNDAAGDALRMVPAYWWMYNMYALARNTWKFAARDKRKTPVQHIEFDSLAPDTAEEIFAALDLLARWSAAARRRADGKDPAELDDEELLAMGREMLAGPPEALAGLDVLADGVERSSRPVVVLKTHAAARAYRDMLHYYAVRNLLDYLASRDGADLAAMQADLAGPRQTKWVNLGGQLVPAEDVERLKTDIKTGALASWTDVHRAYDRLWEDYPIRKQAHALATLKALLGVETLTPDLWAEAIDRAVEIQRYVRDQTYATRKKDFDDPFRRMVYDSDEQMAAVLGSAESNDFIDRIRRQTARFERLAEQAKARDCRLA